MKGNWNFFWQTMAVAVLLLCASGIAHTQRSESGQGNQGQPAPRPERFASVASWTGEFEGTLDREVGGRSDHRKLISGRIEVSGRTGRGIYSGEGIYSWRGTATARLYYKYTDSGVDWSSKCEANGQQTGTAELEIDLKPGGGTHHLTIHLGELATEDVFTFRGVSRRSPTTVGFSVGGSMYLNGILPVEGMTLHRVETDSGRRVEWTLKPVLDELRADPGGPYSPLRGATVTLDGSRSRPSKGRQIRSYKWKLTPTGCPDLGTTTELTGQRVTFKALCAVRAELTVDDGAKTDTRGVEVTVTVRPWKTTLTTDRLLDLRNFVFEPFYRMLGTNRCKRHPDSIVDHIYHPRAGSMLDYEEGTFWLERVADSGPFRGLWFVAKGEFDLPRVLMINQKLYPGGTVYQVNAAKGPRQKNEIDRLRRSVERHESLHSTLLERAVKTGDDPAKAVERGMAKNRDALKDRMNFVIRAAYTRLKEATAEDKVKAEMRKIPEFRAGGRIYYPASGNVHEGYLDFPSFAELGDSGTH